MSTPITSNPTIMHPKPKQLEMGPLLDILCESRLSWSHKVVMTYLSMLPSGTEVTVPQIEDKIPMSHQTVYGSVARLHSLGLINRRVADHPTSITHATVLFSVVPEFRSKLISDCNDMDGGDLYQMVDEATPLPYESLIPLRGLDDVFSAAEIADLQEPFDFSDL